MASDIHSLKRDINGKINPEKLSNQQKKELEDELKKSGIVPMYELSKQQLNACENVHVNIAIAGKSGAGKSTFINAIRQLSGDEAGAAEVGNTQTTMELGKYSDPKNPNVVYWDLPGIGTPDFKQEQYAKLSLERFDFFLILTSERFTENDLVLVSKITEAKKKYFFIRTKMQFEVNNHIEANPKTYKERSLDERLKLSKEKVSTKIRTDIKREIKNVADRLHEQQQAKWLVKKAWNYVWGIRPADLGKPEDVPVFLIDSHSGDRFEFGNLTERVIDSLPEIQQTAMLLSQASHVKELIEKKKIYFLKEIVGGFIKSLTSNDHYRMADSKNSVNTQVRDYTKEFGVDDESLQKLSEQWKVPIDQLKQARDVFAFQTATTIHQLSLQVTAALYGIIPDVKFTRFVEELMSILSENILTEMYSKAVDSNLVIGGAKSAAYYAFLVCVLDRAEQAAIRVNEMMRK